SHPGQSQNSDEQRKEGDADGSQPRNLDASTVVRTGGYPDPRGAWPISTRRDDLRLGVGRLGLWHWLLLHHVIRMNVPESCGRWRPVDKTSKGERCARRSWRDPAGESPAQVRGSARLVTSVASGKVTTTAKRTQ